MTNAWPASDAVTGEEIIGLGFGGLFAWGAIWRASTPGAPAAAVKLRRAIGALVIVAGLFALGRLLSAAPGITGLLLVGAMLAALGFATARGGYAVSPNVPLNWRALGDAEPNRGVGLALIAAGVTVAALAVVGALWERAQ